MANSYVEYTTTGTGTNGLGQATFAAPTKFLSINDIRAKGYSGSTWTELTISSRGTNTVTLSAVPSAYSKVRIYRATTSDQLIDFQAGARLAESDLDTAYNQGLYVAQEVSEDAGAIGTLTTGLSGITLGGTTTTTNINNSGTVTTVGISASGDISTTAKSFNGNPAFSAKMSGSGMSSNSEAWTTMVFGTATTNKGNGYDVSNGKFTVPSGCAGTYFFSVHAAQASSSPAYGMLKWIKTSSSGAVTNFTGHKAYSAGYDTHMTLSIVLDLVAGDGIEVQSYNRFNKADYGSFSGYLIG